MPSRYLRVRYSNEVAYTLDLAIKQVPITKTSCAIQLVPDTEETEETIAQAPVIVRFYHHVTVRSISRRQLLIVYPRLLIIEHGEAHAIAVTPHQLIALLYI